MAGLPGPISGVGQAASDPGTGLLRRDQLIHPSSGHSVLPGLALQRVLNQRAAQLLHVLTILPRLAQPAPVDEVDGAGGVHDADARAGPYPGASTSQSPGAERDVGAAISPAGHQREQRTGLGLIAGVGRPELIVLPAAPFRLPQPRSQAGTPGCPRS